MREGLEGGVDLRESVVHGMPSPVADHLEARIAEGAGAGAGTCVVTPDISGSGWEWVRSQGRRMGERGLPDTGTGWARSQGVHETDGKSSASIHAEYRPVRLNSVVASFPSGEGKGTRNGRDLDDGHIPG